MYYIDNQGLQKEFNIQKGYAYQEDQDSKMRAIRERYNDIQEEMSKIIDYTSTIGYAHCFYNVSNTAALREVGFTNEDILIFLDKGNLCFGGRIGDCEYKVYTD